MVHGDELLLDDAIFSAEGLANNVLCLKGTPNGFSPSLIAFKNVGVSFVARSLKVFGACPNAGFPNTDVVIFDSNLNDSTGLASSTGLTDSIGLTISIGSTDSIGSTENVKRIL